MAAGAPTADRGRWCVRRATKAGGVSRPRGNRARNRGSRTKGRFRALTSRRFLLKTVLVAAVAFGIGYLLVTLFLFGSAPDRVVTVPDLRGVDVEQARSALERADLVFEAGSELVHPRVPAGSVLAQSPLPGQEVAPGSAVQVVVSAGRDRMPIPDVSRLGAQQAVQVLQRTGFQVLLQEVPDLRDSGRSWRFVLPPAPNRASGAGAAGGQLRTAPRSSAGSLWSHGG